jgi:flagellum-specific ATP synthase
VMHNVTTPEHWETSRRFKALYSKYQKARDLIQLGVYAMGSDPETDRAIHLYPSMMTFLSQRMNEAAPLPECVAQMAHLLDDPNHEH